MPPSSFWACFLGLWWRQLPIGHRKIRVYAALSTHYDNPHAQGRFPVWNVASFTLLSPWSFEADKRWDNLSDRASLAPSGKRAHCAPTTTYCRGFHHE